MSTAQAVPEGARGRSAAPRVFISSTYVDLEQHRQAVRDVLLRMGFYPEGMEHWGAQGAGDPTSVSTDKIRGCIAYVGIVAWRYGYIPEGETRSVTHLEYLTARELGIPCYLFLAAPDTQSATGPDDLFPQAKRDDDHWPQLLGFRADLERERVVDYFTTPDGLAAKVASALHDLQVITAVQFTPLTPRDLGVLPMPPEAAIRGDASTGERLGLVGREDELAWLSERIRDRTAKGIWALEGMGGIGKTALVAVCIANLQDHFDGGIAVIVARDVVDPAAILPELVLKFVKGGSDLLARPGVTQKDLSDALLSVLLQIRAENRLALVVIDNVEPALAAHPGLKSLLDLLQTAGVSVVLTSRERLGPYVQESRELATLGREESIELFARVSRRFPHGISPADREELARICDTFAGHALATVVAASDFGANPALSAAAYRARLEQPFALLELSGFEAPKGVGAVFASSYEHLDQPTRDLLSALGVLVDRGCSVEAAVALGMALGQERDQAVARVSRLITSNIAAKVDSAERIEFHPIAQQFARLLFARLGDQEKDRVYAGLAAHYAEWTPRHPTRDLALDDGNILASLEWATHHTPESDVALAGLAYGLRWYWDDRFNPNEAFKWLPYGYAAMRRLERPRLLGGRRPAGLPVGRLRQRRTAVAFALGIHYQLAGDIGAAHRWFKRSHRVARLIWRKQRDAIPLAEAFSGLAAVAQQEGRSLFARRHYRRSLELYEVAGDRKGQADAHYRLGFLALRVGECGDAERHFRQSLALLADVPEDERLRAVNYYSLANVAHQRGEVTEARRRYEEALDACLQHDNRRGQGAILKALGDLAWQTTGPRAAMEFLEASLRTFNQIFDRQSSAVAQYSIAFMHRQVGRVDEAARYYSDSLALRQQTKDRRGEGFVRKAIGDVRRRTAGSGPGRELTEATRAQVRADMKEARAQLRRAMALSREVGDQRNLAVALKALGDWHWQAGDLRAAEQLYRDSLRVRRRVEDKHGIAITRKALADLALVEERFDEAVPVLDECATLFAELEDRRGQGAVLHSRALLAWHRGERDRANDLAQQSLKLLTAVDDVQFQAVALHALAGLAAAHDPDQADERYRAGLELAGRARAVHIFALLEEARGGLLVSTGGPDQRAEGTALLRHAAELLHGLGRAEDARRTLRSANGALGTPTFAATIYDLDEGPNGQGFAIPNDRRRTTDGTQ